MLWLLAPYIGLTRIQSRRGVGYTANLDNNSKSMKDLGLEYHELTDTFQGMLELCAGAGFITKPRYMLSSIAFIVTLPIGHVL